jgi:predicted nucleic acid-binding protein
MASKIRRAWDSCCCFGHLRNQDGRAEACDRVLRDAAEGGSEILISSLAIAEVLHLKGARPIPREMRETIRKFFQRSYFVVADVDRQTAELAQDLFWDRGVRPKDAVHVATAILHGAQYLETFDDGLLTLSRQVGGDPQLVIQKAGVDLVEKAAKKEQDRQRAELAGTMFDEQRPH